jgi:hypothetical protein
MVGGCWQEGDWLLEIGDWRLEILRGSALEYCCEPQLSAGIDA